LKGLLDYGAVPFIFEMMKLEIGRSIFEEMVAHLRSVYPLEGCGLLAGLDSHVQSHYPIDNHLNSPVAFEMEPAQLVASFMDFEGLGQSLLAIYHSHPDSAPTPSARDVQQANYPEAVQIIVSFEEPDSPKISAFKVFDGRFSPITLTVV
jgi:proteasome lid subunit RPN8/RPN11